MWTQVRATELQGPVNTRINAIHFAHGCEQEKKKHGVRIIWIIDILLYLIYYVYIINLLNPTGWRGVQSTHDNCRSKQHRFRDFPSIPWLYDSWSSWYGYRWTSHGVIQNPCWGQGDPLSLMILFYIYVPCPIFCLVYVVGGWTASCSYFTLFVAEKF